MNKKISVKVKKVKVKLSEHDMIVRKEAYYMLLTSLNTVGYCIAQIGIDTLNHKHKAMFKNLHTVSNYFLDNIFNNVCRPEDKEILNDVSFNNVAAATTVFGLISKMPQEEIDWFLNECEKLLFVAYNRQNFKKNDKNNSNNK